MRKSNVNKERLYIKCINTKVTNKEKKVLHLRSYRPVETEKTSGYSGSPHLVTDRVCHLCVYT